MTKTYVLIASFPLQETEIMIQSLNNDKQDHLLYNPWKTITSKGIGPLQVGYQICGHRVVHNVHLLFF